MKHFLCRIFFAAFLLMLLLPAYSFAEATELVNHEFSLAGYHLGMTYDEALFVRPVDFIQDTGSDRPEVADDFFDARANNVYIDDILVNIWLRFKHEKLVKIIVRFTPDKTDELIGRFNQSLGPGEDRSKSLSLNDGDAMDQTVYFWDYPFARLHLVKISNNQEYATIGLTAKPAFINYLVDIDN